MKTICITIIALSVILMNCYAQNVENKTDYFGSSKPNYKPELFGKGIISTQFNELNSSFSPDGNTFLYTIANNSYGNTFYTIFYSKRVNTKWSKPQIASFSGQYSYADPFFSPDGKRIYFISYRPIDKNMKEKNDFDIWFLSYEKGLFGQPQHLGENVNSDKNELYPTVSNNGNLYFSTENGTNGNDLMMSKLIKNVFDKPVSLGDSINTTATEYDAYIAPDENYIIFTSIGRKDGFGSGDLYISFKKEGKWTGVKNLGSNINSSLMDQCPAVSPDGKYFFFTSFREYDTYKFKNTKSTADYFKLLQSPFNGMANVFWVDCKSILSSE